MRKWIRGLITRLLCGVRRSTVDVFLNVTAEVRHAASGQLLQVVRQHNLVPTAGLGLLVAFLAGDAPAGLTHFAVGTDGTAAAAGQTALLAEVYRDTVTTRSQGATSLTVKYYLPSGAANGSTIAEVALLNASSGGTMFARVALSDTIAKTSSVTVTFTWEIAFAAVEG